MQHAKATYAAGKAKDGSYKYAQALKDAGKTWKKKKGSSAAPEVAKAPKKRVRRRRKKAEAEAEPEEQAPVPKKKRRGRASAAPDKLYKSVDSKALR